MTSTLNSLKPNTGSRKKKLRKGRGIAAGQGASCGFGMRGQKSRSGRPTRPGFEGGQMPLYRRVPKLKHFEIINQKKFSVINLEKLNKFNDDEVVNLDSLVKKGLLFKPKFPLKILGNGNIKVKLKVEAHSFTKSAKEKIEAAGVLARIAGLFSGRGYNIESLAVAEVDKKKHISRITIVTEGTPQVIEQINLQLKKLVPVHKVADFKRGEKDILFRELALFKILGNSKKIEKVKKICKKFNPVVLDKTNKSVVIQVTALRAEIDKLALDLKSLGLISTSRTGAVAMTKGPKIFN